MTRKPSPAFADPTESQIQHVAHMLWLESGQLPGRDLENWLAAKELLRHRHGRNVQSRHRVRRVPLESHFPAPAPHL
jgi:hypothetical protein